MSQESLISQLANKAKVFHQNTRISQGLMAKAIGMTEANYSGFLNKKRGLSAESTCLLLKLTNMPRQQAIAQLNKPVLSSWILELPERGKPMRFSNDGWLPREGGTDDPNGTTGITDTTGAQKATIADLLDVFSTLDSLTRQTVIDAITKAHPNANETTAPTTQKFAKRRK